MAEDVVIRTKLEGIRDVEHGLDGIGKKAKGLSDQFNRAGRSLQMFGDGLSRVGSRMSLMVTAPILAAAGAVAKFGIDAVESENLFEVSMGKMAGEARKFSLELSRNLGLNQFETRKMIGTFNQMLVSMTGNTDASFEMSKGLTQLTHDMASFFNLDPADAFAKLQAGITGEIEPLKRLGIVVSETAVKQFALTTGIIKQGEELSETQKILARYGLILESTKNAQGDLARTMESPANQLRQMRARAEEAATQLGISLLPVMTELTKVGATVTQRLSAAVERFRQLNPETQQSIVKWVAFAAAVGPAAFVLGKVVGVFGLMVRGIPLVVKGLVGLVAAFKAVRIAAVAVPAAIAAVASVAAIAIGELIAKFAGTDNKIVTMLESMKGATERTFSSLVDTVSGDLSNIPVVAELVGNDLAREFAVRAEMMADSVGTGAIQMSDALKAFGKNAAGVSKKRKEEEERLADERMALEEDTIKFQIDMGERGITALTGILYRQLALTRRNTLEKLRTVEQGSAAETSIRQAQERRELTIFGRLSDAFKQMASQEIESINDSNISIDAKIGRLEEMEVAYKRLGTEGGGALQLVRTELKGLDKQVKDSSRTFGDGFKAAFKDFSKQATDSFEQGKKFGNDMLNAMSTGISNFLQTGELDFKTFVNTVKASLADLVADELVARIGSLFFDGGSGGGGGGGAGGGILDAVLGGLGKGISNIFGDGFTDLFSGVGDFFSDIFSFADGGRVPGNGGPRSDDVLARLSSGEFVVNAQSAKAFGPLLQAINDNTPGFARGGFVAGDFGNMIANRAISSLASNAFLSLLGFESIGTGAALTGLFGAASIFAPGGFAAAGAVGSIGAGAAAIAPAASLALANLAAPIVGMLATMAISQLFGGSLFGAKPSVGPNASARISVKDGKAFIKALGADNGGNESVAAQMGQRVVDLLNALSAITGKPLRNGGLGAIGYFPSKGGAFSGGGDNRSFFGSDADAAMAAFLNSAVATALPGLKLDDELRKKAVGLVGLQNVVAIPGIGPIVGAGVRLSSAMNDNFSALQSTARPYAIGAGAATGGRRMITRPTLLPVGEQGPEVVDVSPMGSGRRGGITVNVDLRGAYLDEIGASRLKREIARELMTQIRRVG